MNALDETVPAAASPVLESLVAVAALASLAVAWAIVTRLRRGLPVVTPRGTPAVVWGGADVAAVVGTVMVVQVLAAGLVPEDAPLTRRLLASVVGMTVAASLGAWHLHARGAGWRELGLTTGSWREDIRLALFGLALVLWPLLALATLLDRVEPYRHPLIDSLASHRDVPAVALVILSAVVVAPVVEEFLFRRVLQGWLLQRFPGGDGFAAVALQALAFGMAHAGQGLAPVPLTILGIVLGWLTLRTGTLLPGIVLHALFNAVSIALVLTGVAAR